MASDQHAVEAALIELEPGCVSKPSRVWCGSSSVRVGFYQAHPVSPSFTIFYKKIGSVFGSEVTAQAPTIIGPELSVKQPTSIPAQYFEVEIRKLKPNTQYLVKVKTADGRANARSDKLSTISADEQRTRDVDMANFAGALVKLSEYDGSVLKFERETGLFHIRILQIDDVVHATQLVRLHSEYSDSGLPVNAYTLSQVKFGRWGGEINASKVVSEGELKWIVARAIQMEERSESQEGYEARTRLLQLQTERLQAQLQQDSQAQVRKLRLASRVYMGLAILLALLMLLSGAYSYVQASSQQRGFTAELSTAHAKAAELKAQVEQLHLYRLSLELDMAWRLNPGDNCSTWQSHLEEAKQATAASAAAAIANSTASNTTASRNADTPQQPGSESAEQEARKQQRKQPQQRQRGRSKSPDSNVPGAGKDDTAGSSARAWMGGTKAGHTAPGSASLPQEAERLLGLAQIKKLLRRAHWAPPETPPGASWVGAVPEEQPNAWTFIHLVSNQFALYMQEWMKIQLSKDNLLIQSCSASANPYTTLHPNLHQSIRNEVNSMLAINSRENSQSDDGLADYY